MALVRHLERWAAVFLRFQIVMRPELIELVMIYQALHHFIFVSMAHELEASLLVTLRFEHFDHVLHLLILLLLFFN